METKITPARTVCVAVPGNEITKELAKSGIKMVLAALLPSRGRSLSCMQLLGGAGGGGAGGGGAV